MTMARKRAFAINSPGSDRSRLQLAALRGSGARGGGGVRGACAAPSRRRASRRIPSQWPAPSKPYFMIAFDTSGSMTDRRSRRTTRAATRNNRIGHARCAVKNTFLAFAGAGELRPRDVRAGPERAARRALLQRHCAVPQPHAATRGDRQRLRAASRARGAGELGDCRAGAQHRSCRCSGQLLEPAAERRRTSPSSSTWVDNNCTDQQGALRDGNTPLNGIAARHVPVLLGVVDRRRTRARATYASPLATRGAGRARLPLGQRHPRDRRRRDLRHAPADAVDAAADLFARRHDRRQHLEGQDATSSTSPAAIGASSNADRGRGRHGGVVLGDQRGQRSHGALEHHRRRDQARDLRQRRQQLQRLHRRGLQALLRPADRPAARGRRAAQRTTCLTNYQASITPANPTGDLALLPCTTRRAAGRSGELALLRPGRRLRQRRQQLRRAASTRASAQVRQPARTARWPRSATGRTTTATA